jgi:hypothetical protein
MSTVEFQKAFTKGPKYNNHSVDMQESKPPLHPRFKVQSLAPKMQQPLHTGGPKLDFAVMPK